MYVGCVDWEWHWLSASAVPLRHHILIYSIDTVFSLHGYELSLSELVSTTTLVLGLCSLIVGEVVCHWIENEGRAGFDDLIIRRTDRDYE